MASNQTVETVSNAQAINEAVAPVQGIIAACGPAAAYMAAGAINGFKLTAQGLRNLVNKGINAKTLDTGGQNFWAGPKWDLAQYGIPSDVYSNPTVGQLETYLDNALAQNKPVVLGLGQAHNLTSEPPGLHGHFVTIFGKDVAGKYVTGDPNSYAASNDQFTRNTLGQLFDSEVFTVTVPGIGGNGVTLPDISQYTNPLNPQDWSGAIASGIDVGFTNAANNVRTDIGKAIGGWWHTGIRAWIFLTGFIILIISFDKFLGSFDVSGIMGKPGPIEGALRKVQEEGERKGEELAGVATKAIPI